MVTIEQYSAAERASLPLVGNSAIEAFRPGTFIELGYPIAVENEAELIRFVDTMQETYAADYFAGSERYTHDEATIIAGICDAVARVTSDRFSRRVRPWIAPLAAVNLFRVIDALGRLSGRHPLRVFELGPGSGYLGALLAQTAHPYGSMDVTQAFYLWQNRLYEAIAPGEVCDLAGPPASISPSQARIVHVPWWRFVTFHENCPIKADIVVADHALTEMRPKALRYILRVARRLLSGPDLKLFLFASLGYKKFGNLESILSEFANAGFAPVFARRFWGLAPEGSALWKYRMEPHQALSRRPDVRLRRYIRLRRLIGCNRIFGLDGAIPRYDPSGRGGDLLPEEFMRIDPEEAPFDFPFLEAIGIPSPVSVTIGKKGPVNNSGLDLPLRSQGRRTSS